MPAHQRPMPGQGISGQQGSSQMTQPSLQALSDRGPPKAQNIFSKINDDIRALNSSVLVISQKINHLARNEKILGRNHLILNKKIKDLQDTSVQGGETDLGPVQSELAEINRRLSEQLEKIVRLESEVENIKQNFARADQLAEMKYIIDSINPLEFASLKNVESIVEQHMKRKKSES